MEYEAWIPRVCHRRLLDDLHSTIEKMHAEWGGSVNLPERPSGPTRFHLAEVDHALIVDPPAGKELGWVSIVTQVEHPDGLWQDEIIQPWTDTGPWPRR